MWTEMYNRTVGSVRYGASIVVVSVVRPHPISSTIKHLARLDKSVRRRAACLHVGKETQIAYITYEAREELPARKP